MFYCLILLRECVEAENEYLSKSQKYSRPHPSATVSMCLPTLHTALTKYPVCVNSEHSQLWWICPCHDISLGSQPHSQTSPLQNLEVVQVAIAWYFFSHEQPQG